MTVAERREREREERRTHILDAAQQVFCAQGIELATMEQVAEEAQLGKGTLYNYFRTKEDLITAVAQHHQQLMIAKYERHAELAPDGLDLVRRMLLSYAEHMSTPTVHLKMAMSRWVHGMPPNLDQSTVRLVRDNIMHMVGLYRAAIERGQEDGTIRSDLEPPALCLQLWSCVNGALLLELQRTSVVSLVPMLEATPSVADTVELLLDAIRRREDSAPISADTAVSHSSGLDEPETSEAP